jgi:TM2 domain-containing membrane protein YozV
MDYFFAIDGAQRGPFPKQDLIRNGMRPDSLAWREGLANWQRADSLPELADLFQAPAPNVPAGFAPPPPQNFGQQQQFGQQYGPPPYNPASSNRIAAGICGILLGGLGIHKFVLGMTTPGLVMLLVTVLTCGYGGIVMGVIGLIEGIIYLTKSDEEFYQTYVVQKKGWF